MRWLTIPLHRDADVVVGVGRLRAWAEALGVDELSRTRIVTFGAELARAAAASSEGSIEFGWADDDGARPFCSIELPSAHEPKPSTNDLAVDVCREHGRTRFRIDAATNPSRDALRRAIADVPEATATDLLKAQNLEMAQMLGTLRDREVELVRALDEARRSANEAAEHALELEALGKRKDELLAVASHDLRSPIAAAKGALELLDPTLKDLTDDQRHLLGVARRGCDAVVHLLGNLMSSALNDIEDDDPDDPTRVDLMAIVREVVDLMTVTARTKGVDVHCELPASVGAVRGDPWWARQIVANLINNAIKYAPKQGGRVEIVLGELGDAVVLTVDDNGVGVPEGKSDRVFERLTKLRPRGTAGERGTGIGLYVSKKLAERMGGSIALVPREGAGARFQVRWPIAPARHSSQSPRPISASSTPS